jgi:hypothetical protein
MLYVIGLGLCDEKDITIRLGSASRLQDLPGIKPSKRASLTACTQGSGGCEKMQGNLSGGVYLFASGSKREAGEQDCYV